MYYPKLILKCQQKAIPSYICHPLSPRRRSDVASSVSKPRSYVSALGLSRSAVKSLDVAHCRSRHAPHTTTLVLLKFYYFILFI
uniref:Uncharacterized protein n=1 Tax=Kalanchoe fedtschenkoi TaxID=63787 RepID=A0A7N0VJ06_KALFE